jgi:hypothetical protein
MKKINLLPGLSTENIGLNFKSIKKAILNIISTFINFGGSTLKAPIGFFFSFSLFAGF